MVGSVEIEAGEQDGEAELRETPFNPYRYALSDSAKEVVEEAIRLILNYELEFKLKKNKRRSRDQDIFNDTVDAVLSNLLYNSFLGTAEGVHITRSNRVLAGGSRYRPKVYTKMLPQVLDLLAKPEMDYIEQRIGFQNGPNGAKATVIVPGGRLLSRIEEHKLDIDDLGLHPGAELIVLKRLKDQHDFWDEGGMKEYEDTSKTEDYREEIRQINSWLETIQLEINHSCLDDPEKVIDTNDRALRRVFTKERFDKGGRLFGGFWQAMSKADRATALTIEGEPAVELDFGQAGARILYGMAEQSPPNDDLYCLPGYQKQRDGIKRVMSAMMFATNKLNKMPKGTRKLFRQSDQITEVQDEIERRHPAIARLFYKGIGHDIQFTESQIMVSILLQLERLGIAALPIHDAVMVPASKALEVEKVMSDTFQRIAGVPSIVTLEH